MKPFLRARRVRALRERKRFARENARNPPHPCEERDRVTLFRELHRLKSRGRDEPFHPAEYAAVLGLAGRLRAIKQGIQIHEHILHCRLYRQWKIVVHLIRMYGRCGSIRRALRCFHELRATPVPVWAAAISALARNDYLTEARGVFRTMILRAARPDEQCYVAVLGACSGCRCLAFGRDLHAKVGLAGMDADPGVCNAVIAMYGRCQAPESALETFERMGRRRTPLSWVTLAAAFAESGQLSKSQHFARLLVLDGAIDFSADNLARMLLQCERRSELRRGEVIHSLAAEAGVAAEQKVAQALMRMYGRCCKVSRARAVFDGIAKPRSRHLWSSLLRAYASDPTTERGTMFALLEEMKSESRVTPAQETVFTLASVARSFEEVKAVHAWVVKTRCLLGPVLRELLIEKYKRCECVADGWEKFRQMHARFKEGMFTSGKGKNAEGKKKKKEENMGFK